MSLNKQKFAYAYWSKQKNEDVLITWLGNDVNKYGEDVLDLLRKILHERNVYAPEPRSEEGRKLLETVLEEKFNRVNRISGLKKSKKVNKAHAMIITMCILMGRWSVSFGLIYGNEIGLGLAALFLLRWRWRIIQIQKEHNLSDRADLGKL